jgi:hypothetical protein
LPIVERFNNATAHPDLIEIAGAVPQRNKPAIKPVLWSIHLRSRKFGATSMADDLKNRGAQDRSRISMHEEHEVRYWTKALGVSKEELASAVAKVGNSADAVRRELGK